MPKMDPQWKGFVRTTGFLGYKENLWFIYIETEGSLKDHMLRKYPLAVTLKGRSVIKLAK